LSVSLNSAAACSNFFSSNNFLPRSKLALAGERASELGWICEKAQRPLKARIKASRTTKAQRHQGLGPGKGTASCRQDGGRLRIPLMGGAPADSRERLANMFLLGNF